MWMLTLVTLMVLGQPAGVVTMGDMEASDDFAVVRNTAICFREAVEFLQDVPSDPSAYAGLLLETKEILDGIGIRLGEGDFNLLIWSDDSLHAVVPSGSRILCELIDEEHDQFQDASSMSLTYVFRLQEEDVADTIVVEVDF